MAAAAGRGSMSSFIIDGGGRQSHCGFTINDHNNSNSAKNTQKRRLPTQGSNIIASG